MVVGTCVLHDFPEYADRLAVGPDLLRLGIEPDALGRLEYALSHTAPASSFEYSIDPPGCSTS